MNLSENYADLELKAREIANARLDRIAEISPEMAELSERLDVRLAAFKVAMRSVLLNRSLQAEQYLDSLRRIEK